MNFSQLGLGFFSLKIYGILVAIAFVLAVLKFFGVVRKNNFDLDFFIHHFWRWVVSGIILGRIFILILYPEIFSRNGIFSFFAFWDGEVHFLGSLLGFLLVAYFDLRAHDKSFFKWLDAGIPSILVGVFIVDIAGFFTGAVYGNETSLFWGVQYETSGVDILNPVHPVTIYAAILHFLIFRWTKLYQKAFSRIPGKLSVRVGILFFLTDAVLQFMRGDSTVMIFNSLRLEQCFDIVILAFLFFMLKFKKFNLL